MCSTTKQIFSHLGAGLIAILLVAWSKIKNALVGVWRSSRLGLREEAYMASTMGILMVYL